LGADTRAKKHVRKEDDNGSAGRGKKVKMATEEDKGNCEVWRSGFVWKTGRFKVGL
jgi:hypothetical protein